LPYGEIAHGLWLPRGGMYALIEAVARLATELGARLHTGCRVAAIETAGRRVSGLRFADGTKFEAPVIVSNVDLPTTEAELLATVSSSRARRLRMTPGVVTFYWGVRGEVPGLAHHTVFLPDDYRRAFDQLARERRVPDDLPFYVSVASATDRSLAPPGDSAVFVLVPTPVLSARPGLDWAAEVERLKRMVLERLAVQGVELPAASIVTEEVWSPVEWSRRFGLHDGSAFGAAHGFFQVGPFRPANYDRKIDGIYYAGASTTPGTGLPMVLLSGRLAAERVVERERRHGA
jgi:phytoene desaturase